MRHFDCVANMYLSRLRRCGHLGLRITLATFCVTSDMRGLLILTVFRSLLSSCELVSGFILITVVCHISDVRIRCPSSLPEGWHMARTSTCVSFFLCGANIVCSRCDRFLVGGRGSRCLGGGWTSTFCHRSVSGVVPCDVHVFGGMVHIYVYGVNCRFVCRCANQARASSCYVL